MNDLARHVHAAAARGEVREAVGLLYADLQAEIAARQPVCRASGRCCRFDQFGHRLYITTMELARFVHDLDALDQRPQTVAPDVHPGLHVLPEHPAGCPFQVGKLCGVHAIRPFGCRIFFCDPTSTEWQSDQYERFHRRLKKLHGELGVPYHYVEWREAMRICDF